MHVPFELRLREVEVGEKVVVVEAVEVVVVVGEERDEAQVPRGHC